MVLSKYLHVKARQHTVDALKAATSFDLTTAISRKKEERLKNSKLEQEENKKQTENRTANKKCSTKWSGKPIPLREDQLSCYVKAQFLTHINLLS